MGIKEMVLGIGSSVDSQSGPSALTEAFCFEPTVETGVRTHVSRTRSVASPGCICSSTAKGSSDMPSRSTWSASPGRAGPDTSAVWHRKIVSDPRHELVGTARTAEKRPGVVLGINVGIYGMECLGTIVAMPVL